MMSIAQTVKIDALISMSWGAKLDLQGHVCTPAHIIDLLCPAFGPHKPDQPGLSSIVQHLQHSHIAIFTLHGSLLLITVRKEEPSPYKHVTKKKDSGTWQVSYKGQTRTGFLTAKAAAEKASELSGSPVRQLRKYEDSPHQLVERFKVMIKLYNGGKEVPGHVQSLEQHAAKTSKSMFLSAPSTEVFSVMGQLGPFQDALQQHFKMQDIKDLSPASLVRGPRSKGQAKTHLKKATKHLLKQEQKQRQTSLLTKRAGVLWNHLARTTEVMNGMDLDLWEANCGQNLSGHSGFVPALQRCNMLGHVPAAKSKFLKLTIGPGIYATMQILRNPEDKEVALDKLCRVIELTDSIQEYRQEAHAPTTCTEWTEYIEGLKNAAGLA